MKRLPGIGFGLALVVHATLLSPVAAQPVDLDGPAPALSRQSLTEPAGTSPASDFTLYNTSLVLASLTHLPLEADTAISASVADKPTLGYVAPSLAATLPNVDPFLATSLGRLHTQTLLPPRATASALVTPAAMQPTLVANQTAVQSTLNWRLGSRFAPPSSGGPLVNVPSTGVTTGGNHPTTTTPSGLGRGTIALGGFGSNFVGVPEPSTYLLCGVAAVLGGTWFLRRRSKTPAPKPDLRTLMLGETGESLSGN